VTLRDGLQDEAPVATDDKVALFHALVAAGIDDLELTSFVRPDRVPALADAERLAARVRGTGDGPTVWALVLNARGAERALATGVRHLQFVVSVSERHNLENAGRTVAASLDELGRILALDGVDGTTVEVTAATAFGCPFTGPVPAGAVVALATEVGALGVRRWSVADTIGTAVPTEVRAVLASLRDLDAEAVLGVHLHDTRGLALANALAALEEGVDRIDGTVGGLGGCPFAPGATGNLALEDLVHALEAMGVPTGIDLDGLLAAARLAAELTGRPVGSRVGVAGARFARTPYGVAAAGDRPD
jgi:hydroxymethylglutaryl-CoA lyase